MSEVTARIAGRFGVAARMLPATDDRVVTRIDAVDPRTGEELDLHFQEYWVRAARSRRREGVRLRGAAEARPAPGVLESIGEADAVIFCPSNPVVSIGPILAVPGIRDAVAARRRRRRGCQRDRGRRAAGGHGRPADAGRGAPRSSAAGAAGATTASWVDG